jgi:hypothetical protein
MYILLLVFVLFLFSLLLPSHPIYTTNVHFFSVASRVSSLRLVNPCGSGVVWCDVVLCFKHRRRASRPHRRISIVSWTSTCSRTRIWPRIDWMMTSTRTCRRRTRSQPVRLSLPQLRVRANLQWLPTPRKPKTLPPKPLPNLTRRRNHGEHS